MLNASGVRQIRGFYTNDTHSNWTIDEIRWGMKVSRMTHGAHFIVNTATNGRGPLRPHNRVRHGNEVLCNPPGRGIGPLPTTTTGFAQVDAFLWTGPPGNSSGHCHGGTAAGTFWAKRARRIGGPGARASSARVTRATPISGSGGQIFAAARSSPAMSCAAFGLASAAEARAICVQPPGVGQQPADLERQPGRA